MARKSIKSNYYLFDASAREVVIPGGIQREQLVLITNVTDNKVIYNFSDPELTATEYHISTDIRNVVTTRLVLAYDTTSMSDTDKLQIVYDDFEETVIPSETYHDAVNKQRVSNPQSQIDTDFEYGTQDTKWEGLPMINNNPFAYKSQNPVSITQIEATNKSREIKISVDTGVSSLPPAGTAIYVQDTVFDGANGVFIVDRSGTGDGLTNTEVTYTAKYAWSAGSGSIEDSTRTAVYTGIHYTGSEIGGSVSLSAVGGGVEVSCSNVHGLEVGNEIAIAGSSGTNVNGSWVVATVTSPTTFIYYTNGTPSGGVGSGTIKLYPRPQGSSVHRAFDGGVKFSTNSPSKNQQAVRQTKRYFRYQSGKGVAFSTGSILAPAIENIDSIFAGDGVTPTTTITVVSAVPHNLTTDTIVDVRGVNDNNYNGERQVNGVIDAYTFTYSAASTPTEAVGSGEYTVSPINSYGVNLEIGMMDQQNGLFFRYGNGQLSVVRRSSTFQISGRVNVTAGSSLVTSFTGPNSESTKFSKQLKPGDYVVIRGSSYRIDGIISDTQMVIFPDYRGTTSTYVPVTKTVETIWDQEEWNLDRCDGTGKSGYTIDVTKMQMFYMDYSWYGAGFIRWGFRATDGNIIYAHKIPNNNANTEAYMRSGNLPARYEVNTVAPSVLLYKDLSNSGTTIYSDKSPRLFPPSGTLRLSNVTGTSPTIQGDIEYVNYTGLVKFKQDVIEVNSNNIVVADTGQLTAGGIQPITFDRPFSNIVAGKRYFVASKTTTSFQITDTAGSSTGISLTNQIGSALSPLAVAESGAFTGLTREQSGSSSVGLSITAGNSTATVISSANIQIGQRVVGTGVDADTYVIDVPNATSVTFSKAVLQDDPTVDFKPMGSGSASGFTYSSTQPVRVELLQATSVPSISHWGSSVIMEGELDEDRAYVYSIGTLVQNEFSKDTKNAPPRGILALRLAPSVDNGIPGEFGARELVNRMQLVLRQVDISSTGKFYVQLHLNPKINPNGASPVWENIGGTSLAQYTELDPLDEIEGGEVIFAFYSDNGVNQYRLDEVKEISNSILGGGYGTYTYSTGADATGVFPDGPETLVISLKNISTGNNTKRADARISWTEAQA